MSYSIKQISFSDIASYFSSPGYALKWEPIFIMPQWLNAWWESFGSGSELYATAVWEDNRIIGIAPLRLDGQTARFIGSADVCDYLDFITAPGAERAFFSVLLNEMVQKGIKELDLVSLRPDSSVITYLLPLAQERSYKVSCVNKDVSVELDLPQSWDRYLMNLDKKQRHEIRRKLSRLEKSGVTTRFYTMEDRRSISGNMNRFFSLFVESRQDKAAFMTPGMKSFFETLADAMSQLGLLKLGVFELNRVISAMVMFFDYQDRIYLYNSGYNPEYGDLSIGLISKVSCIQDSIHKGRKKFDFLKGAEPYKYYLGGTEVPIYSCQINLERA